MSMSEFESCGFLCVFPAVWQQQSSSSGGWCSGEQWAAVLSLPRAGHSDVGSLTGTWLLYPLYGDIWVGKHDCFPLVSAEGGSHLRSTVVGTLFMHHPVAGKILYFVAVAFFFSFKKKIIIIFHCICTLLMGKSQIMSFILNNLHTLFQLLGWRNPLRTGAISQSLNLPLKGTKFMENVAFESWRGWYHFLKNSASDLKPVYWKRDLEELRPNERKTVRE